MNEWDLPGAAADSYGPIIDANACFGFDIAGYEELTPERLMRIMDGVGITQAVVTSLTAMWYDFREANDETAALVRRNPERFVGLLSVQPYRYQEVVEEIRRGVEELGLRGLRLFTHHIFDFGSLMLARIMKEAAHHGLPVFFSSSHPTAFPGSTLGGLLSLAGRHRDVDLVISGIATRNLAEAIIALQEAPNIYLDLSWYNVPDGIAFLAREASVERLLYASGLPLTGPSGPLRMIQLAALSNAEKAAILGGNIARLLRLDEAPA